MEWSPQHALNAYLHTLQLCKIYNNQGCNHRSTKVIEPKSTEFISALAAGKRAKLMVEITLEGITPLTIALAVAAKQTGSRFICILLHRDDLKKSKAQLIGHDLEDVIEFVYGNPFEVIMQYKNIDFAVIDCKFEDHSKLFKLINVNPSWSIVVLHNLHHRKESVSFAQVMKGKKIVQCVTLPIGEGMELTRIRSTSKRESWRCRRFHVTYEN